ncbi:hypothetical protein ACVWW1_003892 [Bradyrhizobium sp. JR3.5]
MAGGLERGELCLMRGVVLALGAQVDEEAVVAVDRGVADGFALDRDQALAVLAGRFRDQLLGPGAEIGDLGGGEDRHLVAAFEPGDAHRQPELDARVFLRRHVGAAGAHHGERMTEQAADVDACGRRRHQAERRQHGIAAADRGIAVEDTGKALLDRDLLQRRAGVGHRDEAMAGLVLADRLGHPVEEIVLHHVRLGRAARFGGDDEQRLGDVDILLHRAHLRRIGGVEHVQPREAGLVREGLRQHLRPEARSAHAEHNGVGEVLALHALGEILVVGDVGGRGAGQPAQPFVLVIAGPDRLVLVPEPSDLGRRTPFLGAFLDRLLDAGAERQLLMVDAAAERGRALVGDRAVQLVGRVGEQLDAVLDQLLGDRIERDAGLLQLLQHVAGVLDILLEAVADLAVVAEGIEGCRRHGVDGIGANQLLDIEHVAIVLVLGAGRSPQQPLRLGALGRELVPARAREQALVVLVGELCIGDRDLALQGREPLLLGRVVGACDLLVELLVDGAVDAADEEAGDACHMGGVAALGDVLLQALKIGLRDLAIDLLREQQRDVDADAFADQILDRRQALRRRRHLDHQVLAVNVLPEPLGLRDRALGVHREIGRHFEADEAVAAMALVVDRAQHVGGVLDVLDREVFEQVGDRAVALLEGLADRPVILVRAADRLLEDRGVGRHTFDAVGLDQPLQVALGDEAAGKEVQPDGLAVIFECFDGVHGCLFSFDRGSIFGFPGSFRGWRRIVNMAGGPGGISAFPRDNAIHNSSIPSDAGASRP